MTASGPAPVDFGAVLVGVAAGLIVALLLACARWLSRADNRLRLRQRFFRHDWERREGIIDDPQVIFPPQPDRCRKCGLER